MIELLLDIKNLFILSVLKAAILKSDLRSYKYEKQVASKGNGLDDEEVKHSGIYFFGFILPFCQNAKKKDENGLANSGILHRLLNDGSTENFILKSIFGFLGGTILTYICYLFLIYSLNFTLKRATLICMGLGITLSLGLAFSDRIRCTVLLCIPQLFSKRGRQALLAYAFILALSGPAKNTLHNVEVMSESLACGQEQLKKAENELMKCVHRPNTAAKQSLEKMLIKLDFSVKEYQNFIEKFYQLCSAVMETIIHTQEWLYSIYFLCNQKMGSPYSRCTDLLFEASQNCKSISMEPAWINACDVANVQDEICISDDASICSVEDLPPLWPFINHRNQLNDFIRKAINWIYVKIESHQIFTPPNRTATLHEEYQGMATEIRQKTDQFLQYFDLMSVIFGIFILVLFIKVIIYRYKFLTEDEYDNRFITSDFVDIDRTRAEFRMQTLLPLELREEKKYIRVASMQLLSYEKTRLFSSFIFLVIATFKIIIHIFTDSSLYWMLSTMRRHGRMLLYSNNIDQPQIAIIIEGESIFAQLLRNVTKVVKPYAIKQILDPVPCLPDPISPDWNRYCQIFTLVIICWLLALCEPYGLRLRHIVMVTYHPDRARERAIWLYNRILTTRMNYVKFARRQLRRKYKSLDENLFYKTTFLKRKRSLRCLLCKNFLKPNEYYKCPTIGCVGLYCNPCFDVLQLCSICKDPSYYGDYSDISEEKDSEEEEIQCSKCGLFSKNHAYQRPFTERNLIYRSSETGHTSFKYRQNLPKYQISMDTVVDFNPDDDNESEDSSTMKTTVNDLPVESPSVFARLLNHCKKALGMKNVKEQKFDGRAITNCVRNWKNGEKRRNESFRSESYDSAGEESSKSAVSLKIPISKLKTFEHKKIQKREDATATKASSGTGKTKYSGSKSRHEEKSSKKLPQTIKKQSLALRTLRGLNRFKWKLKEKTGSSSGAKKAEKRMPKQFKKLSHTAKNVGNTSNHLYYFDVYHDGKVASQERKYSLKRQSSTETYDRDMCEKRRMIPRQLGRPEAFNSGNSRDSYIEESSSSATAEHLPLYSRQLGREGNSEKFENRRDTDKANNINYYDTDKNERYKLQDALPFSVNYPDCECVSSYDSLTAREVRYGSRQSGPANQNVQKVLNCRHDLEINYEHENLPKLYKKRSDFIGPGAQSPQTSSGKSRRNDLMDKETETHQLGHSLQCSSMRNEESSLNSSSSFAERFRSPVDQASRGNSPSEKDAYSSIPTSSASNCSDCGAVRKQLIYANGRKQKIRASAKPRQRSDKTNKRKRGRCRSRWETTSDGSANGTETKSNSGTCRTIKPRLSESPTNPAQKAAFKSVGAMKAKLAEFLRRSIKRPSPSRGGGCAETKSENESKGRNRETDDKTSDRTIGRKSSYLPWAPGSLSDLPPSQSDERSSEEPFPVPPSSSEDSEFERDDDHFTKY